MQKKKRRERRENISEIVDFFYSFSSEFDRSFKILSTISKRKGGRKNEYKKNAHISILSRACNKQITLTPNSTTGLTIKQSKYVLRASREESPTEIVMI